LRRLVCALIALAVLMGSDLAWARRSLHDKQSALVNARGRFVDFGVVLRVVKQDLVNGTKLRKGWPKMVVLREHRLGGMVDTQSNPPSMIGASKNPVIWHCSEDQEPIILHGDQMALGLLVYGSEGAGKTTCLVMWHWINVLKNLGEGREGGQTAPTEKRLNMVRAEVRKLWRSGWYVYKKTEKLYEVVDGTRLQLVSTHQQSKDEGSPVQGFSWSWGGRDEGQDQLDAHEDIESRGREAADGNYKQLITATAKDSSRWRDWRDAILAAKVNGVALWERKTLLGKRSPFIDPSFWANKAAGMDPREYRRRVDAEDVAPELAVYHGWDRERNLVARPRIACDATAAVLSGYQSYCRPGAGFSLLAGHDPGNIYNTTTFLRLLMFGEVPTWVVVGEIQTKQTTAEQHAIAVRDYVQATFGIERGAESSKVLVICDPHGRGEGQTDYQTVYMAFQRVGLDVFSAAPKTQRIKRSARVGMLNRLLGDATKRVRLVVASDEGRCLAPVLVDALESLQKKPGDEDPEGSQRKDEGDKTHAPAATGYALWLFEQEAFTDATQAVAARYARGRA